eukprot:7678886-Pyramimonas_sp.AAC.1
MRPIRQREHYFLKHRKRSNDNKTHRNNSSAICAAKGAEDLPGRVRGERDIFAYYVIAGEGEEKKRQGGDGCG